MTKPTDVDESDIADLYSPWRSAFALVAMAIALSALAFYPPTAARAVLYVGAGALAGYAVGATEHIIQLQERRAWRRMRELFQEVTGRAN